MNPIINLGKNNNGDLFLNDSRVCNADKIDHEEVALKICYELFPAAKANNLYMRFYDMYLSELDLDGTFNQNVDISVFISRYRGSQWQDTKTLLNR